MSQWTEAFNGHQIHQTVNDAITFLGSEPEEVSGSLETQRRRLLKILKQLQKTLSAIDPEVVPMDQLNALDQHL